MRRYLLAVSEGHVYPWWPAISATGTLPPESCWFGLFTNISTFLCNFDYLFACCLFFIINSSVHMAVYLNVSNEQSNSAYEANNGNCCGGGAAPSSNVQIWLLRILNIQNKATGGYKKRALIILYRGLHYYYYHIGSCFEPNEHKVHIVPYTSTPYKC